MTRHNDFFIPNARQTDLLAAHLPQGGVWDAAWRDDSNLRALLRGLSGEFFQLETEIYRAAIELDPSQTDALITEWERSVGIPDPCLKTDKTLIERREQVLLKLRDFRIQTAQDFIDLASLFGEEILIEPGAIRGVYGMKYPLIYYPSAKAARFTMIVHFPNRQEKTYPFVYPHPYQTQTSGIVECLITRLRPAMVDVKFSYGTFPPN